MKIFAIVVTYNGMKWYDRCFGSLRTSDTEVCTIVVDNASSDNTIEYIRDHFPEVHIIESKENLGFAKANNIGIKYALDNDADYVFLLNQDAWVESGTLTQLVHTFDENNNVGIASPMHMNGSFSALDERFCACLPKQMISDGYVGEMKPYYQVPYVNAAAWLISKECIRMIGGFDTSVFTHCGEDDNYCQRLRYHNFKLMVSTSTRICHDREHRDPNNDCNRTFWMDVIRKEELAEKWSNINDEISMEKVLHRLKWKLRLSLLFFQKKQIAKYRELVDICKKVAISREINRQKGLHWIE